MTLLHLHLISHLKKYFLHLHSVFWDSATDGTDIHGYFGKGATITCSYSWASTNIKYFCRDPCNDIKDILVQSDQSPTGRYTLKDSGEGTFTVNITDLQESDSGIYWCGVERFGFDSFKKVILTVSKGKNGRHSFNHICSWTGHCSSVQGKIQDISKYVHMYQSIPV
uniref:Immunoglobulin domain-containing protein n=1 Tax=Sinocyclocheilus anshuiensis TaxID=1608454 RepID=A0A671P785_9TELE